MENKRKDAASGLLIHNQNIYKLQSFWVIKMVVKVLWKLGNNSIYFDIKIEITNKVSQANNIRFDTFNFLRKFWENKNMSVSNIIYNGEFDPGSGWTLAAGLIHASRGVEESLLSLRPANGCGTRTEPSFERGIAQRNLD